MTQDKRPSFSFGFTVNPQGNSWTNAPPVVPPRLTVETDEFLLNLTGDWVQHESEEPQQFQFASERLGATVIISYVQGQIPREKLLDAAKTLSRARIEAEVEFDPNMEPGQSWVELREEDNGDVFGHVAYACYNQSSIRRFMGWTTQVKFLSLWVCTEGRDDEHSKRVFDEVFAGFSYYMP